MLVQTFRVPNVQHKNKEWSIYNYINIFSETLFFTHCLRINIRVIKRKFHFVQVLDGQRMREYMFTALGAVHQDLDRAFCWFLRLTRRVIKFLSGHEGGQGKFDYS